MLYVGHSTVNGYLNKFLEKPRQIRKNFYLLDKQMKQRVVLKKRIKGEDIFFSDETQIDLFNYTNDCI